MTVNPKIISTLKEFNIPVDDALSYLLSIYFNCRPSYTPPVLVQRLNITNILGVDSERKIIWNIPLFESTTSASVMAWEWVNTWNDKFGQINPKRKASNTTVLTRMKAFFAENPDVRKEEVIGATKMYFSSLSSADYLITSSYFIFKDKGKDRTSALGDWVERYRQAVLETTPSGNPEDVTSQMQG